MDANIYDQVAIMFLQSVTFQGDLSNWFERVLQTRYSNVLSQNIVDILLFSTSFTLHDINHRGGYFEMPSKV